MGSYITGTNHVQTLLTALDAFHRALTRRWREIVCEAIVNTHEIEGGHNFPLSIRAQVDSYVMSQRGRSWDYRHFASRAHLEYGGGRCDYVVWVRAGQNGDLSSVSCDGATSGGQGVDFRLQPSETIDVPSNIECGMGSILQEVENWAWAERGHVFQKLPLFDSHDLTELHRAHDKFISLGKKLGLQPASVSGVDGFEAMDAGELPTVVGGLGGETTGGKDWWAGWTGLLASRAKDGFFASVKPSLTNQSNLAGMLANLYSDRAAIIESSRNNGLHLVERAIEALDATEEVTSYHTDEWKVVQGIGAGVALGFAWSTKGAAVGDAIALVGFLGENLDPGSTRVQFANSIEECVGQLNDKVDELTTELEGLESDYHVAAVDLRLGLYGVHSYNLELYDLTQNDPEGDKDEWDDQSGFEAEVEDVLEIARHCYEAGEQYEGLLPLVRDTYAADGSLADQDGAPTTGDEIVLELRNQLYNYLRTTCGRYLVAGNQVRDAAEAYVEVDTSERGAFERTMGDWAEEGVGEYDVDLTPAEVADETDRSPVNPYEALDPGPGQGDGEDYVIETDR